MRGKRELGVTFGLVGSVTGFELLRKGEGGKEGRREVEVSKGRGWRVEVEMEMRWRRKGRWKRLYC